MEGRLEKGLARALQIEVCIAGTARGVLSVQGRTSFHFCVNEERSDACWSSQDDDDALYGTSASGAAESGGIGMGDVVADPELDMAAGEGGDEGDEGGGDEDGDGDDDDVDVIIDQEDVHISGRGAWGGGPSVSDCLNARVNLLDFPICIQLSPHYRTSDRASKWANLCF